MANKEPRAACDEAGGARLELVPGPILAPDHRQHLLEELGSEEAVSAAVRHGARSIDANEARRLGFRYGQHRTGGLLLPFGGDFAQLRCDTPPITRSGDQVKYLGRKGVSQQPATFGSGSPTIATEGWKDALRIHLATGETTQAIAGVASWRLLDDAIELLIYDADAAANPSVWGQLIRAGLERRALRLAFFPRELAGPKGGACEFFSAGGSLDAVKRWKARELLRELPSQWGRDLRPDWHGPAINRLAALGLEAGLSSDAVSQLVTAAARRIGLPVRRAKQIHGVESRKRTPAAQCETGIPRTDAPPERQAAEILHAEQGLVARFAGRFHRYDAAAGYWRPWPLEEVQAAALAVLKRLYKPPSDPGERPWFGFGTDREVQAAASLLATAAGPGPLRNGAPPPVIVFGNGTLDLRTGRLGPHDADNGATFAVDADYLPAAACPAPLQRVIETCFPEGAGTIIRAAIRWLVDPTVRYGEAFHLVGGSGSGKGTILELLTSLVPRPLQARVDHPASLDGPEKLHQLVRGRRLVVFPDTPIRPRRGGHCGAFYELVENAPQTTRRLFSSDAEDAAPMHARCLLASVAPLHFGSDGRDGFLRRVLTLQTLPRSGDPCPALKADLVGDSPQHRLIRSQAVSWALAMPMTEVEEVLNKNDPEGLLRQGDAEAAAAGDTVSQFVDACLIPHPLGPQAEVDDFALGQMFEAYRGWCRYAGVEHAAQLTNFQGQLRSVLGPGRCLPRRKESMREARTAGRLLGERHNLPRLDAGFALRPGILRSGPLGEVGGREDFNRLALGFGGLEALAALRPALRQAPESPETTPPRALRQAPESPESAPSKPTANADEAPAPGAPAAAGDTDSPETTAPVSGLKGPDSGPDSGPVSGQSLNPTSQSGTGISADSEGLSQGSPSNLSIEGEIQEAGEGPDGHVVSPHKEAEVPRALRQAFEPQEPSPAPPASNDLSGPGGGGGGGKEEPAGAPPAQADSPLLADLRKLLAARPSTGALALTLRLRISGHPDVTTAQIEALLGCIRSATAEPAGPAPAAVDQPAAEASPTAPEAQPAVKASPAAPAADRPAWVDRLLEIARADFDLSAEDLQQALRREGHQRSLDEIYAALRSPTTP